VEREAFARAWRFLDYKPASKWLALTASVATGLLYVGLFLVLALFADLLVNSGRIPIFQNLPALERAEFLDLWNTGLATADRKLRLEVMGIDSQTAGEVAAQPDLSRLAPVEQELAWRAEVYQVLADRVGLKAATLTLPDYGELSPRMQEAFRASWKKLPASDRGGQLASVVGEERAGALAKADPAKLSADDWTLAWRSHLWTTLGQRSGAAVAYHYLQDRASRAGIAAAPNPWLADRGILSLVVRSQFHGFDRTFVPVLGQLAALFPWTWDGGEAITPRFYYYPTVLLVAAAILALLRALLMYVANSEAASATIEATNRLRRAVYHHAYRMATMSFRAIGTSEAVGVFTRQLEAVHEGIYTWLTVAYREPVKLALLLIFALLLNVWLSLAFICFALLVWLVGGQVAAYFRSRERAAMRRAAEHLALLNESITLMRLVKIYLMELFNQARVERQLADYGEAQMHRYRGEAFYRPVLIFLGTLAAIGLLYLAGLVVLSGRLGVARAIILATVLASMYWPLVNWLEHLRFMRRGRQAAIPLFKFLDRRGEISQVAGAEFVPPLGDQLELDNVSLREPGTGKVLLSNVSVTIRAGERVALVGPDEMEKQAFIYLIPRLMDPDSGEIRIDRHNLRWVTLDSLRAQIALVLQRNLVFNDTVANNIGCGDSSFTLPRIIEAAKVAHAHQFIQKLPQGYETVIGEMGHHLNTGELYRLALARGILRDPALLIIEEPTALLDDDTKSLLDDTYARVLPNRTVIFLPHRVSTIRSCDRVFLLHKGQIEAAGDHREMLAQSELYRHLQYLEFNVFADQYAPQGVLS
jgi:ATP-binding cassette subfamily B protein